MTEGEIYNEFASEMVVVALVAEDPNFVGQQRALYKAALSACASYNVIATEMDAKAVQTIMDKNMAAYVGSSASFAAPMLFAPGCNDHKSIPSMSIVDPTSIGDVHS